MRCSSDAGGEREQRDEDREQRHAGELDVGEIGEARRRLDLQAAAVGDVDRMDDEARRQRRDDRRNAQRPDQQIVGDADREAAAERGGEAERDERIVAAHGLHRDRAGEADIGGQRQVDVAGAERDDEHLPDADDDREHRERQRRRQHAARAVAAGVGDGADPDERGADEGQIQGQRRSEAKSALIGPCPSG